MAKKKKLKVAFPHMGTISIAWAAGLRKIGVEPSVPPYTSKKTLSLGTKNSPEAICLPYKLILIQLIWHYIYFGLYDERIFNISFL